MKTKIYLSVFLALTIQVMVNGQTQGTRPSSKLGAVIKHHTPAVIKIQTTSDGRYVIPSVTKQNAEAEMILAITALENEGKQNRETYNANKKDIDAMLTKSDLNIPAGKEIQNLVSEAAINIRRGAEIRQEAYAMPTTGAKLGALSNANEKEIIAISEQNQAIHIIKSYAACRSIGIDLSSYAVK